MPLPVKGLLQPLSQLLATGLGTEYKDNYPAWEWGGEPLAFVDSARTRPRSCFASNTDEDLWSHLIFPEASYNQEIDELHDIILFPCSASF